MNKNWIRITLTLLTMCLLTGTAEARRHHRVSHAQPQQSQGWADFSPMFTFGSFQSPVQTATRTLRQYGNVQMLAHPSGCPRRLFCGCGAAVAVFGTPRRDLWLASNWLKFPRAHAAPGMVAARRDHVFVLHTQNSDGTWVVEDYNSGHGQSRIHTRSIQGFAIVNPRA